jgi:hypothetical protein
VIGRGPRPPRPRQPRRKPGLFCARRVRALRAFLRPDRVSEAREYASGHASTRLGRRHASGTRAQAPSRYPKPYLPVNTPPRRHRTSRTGLTPDPSLSTRAHRATLPETLFTSKYRPEHASGHPALFLRCSDVLTSVPCFWPILARAKSLICKDKRPDVPLFLFYLKKRIEGRRQ